ncbi:MAG: glycoside hydrolase family 3 protein [Bacillus sp. (in: Bacteria)]|nr:glycoside hydrolase family 3 protein [Bacillus sp. (in: firmicutes)]MCM1426396.1 glycoside hydrolase family 3 protein [Eubacterium sp.]
MDLKKAPFYLRDVDIAWVEKTLEQMTLEEKIGQLFCPIGYSTDPEYLDMLLGFHIGGLFFRDGVGEEMRKTFEYAQKHSPIPLLIPSNLEAGGDGAAIDGTPYGKQMACAAAGDKKYAYRLGKIACTEAAALGINWAFAPVVDIDKNFHNPITNVRTYGDNPETVYTYAREYMRAAAECDVAVSIKHFPGDGVDERDQHLLTSVNSLSMEQWDETYGMVFGKLIADGALTVMAGHIAMPAYQEYYNPQTKGDMIPASLSKELLQNLLRGKLGFNGLIISDATPMVGFTSAMAREKSVPLAIESGCDMFLFNKDLAEDYQFMMDGYKNGILSEKRLLEANRRILALKAALKLHEKSAAGTLVPDKAGLTILKNERHIEWAKELADVSITLVKDEQKLLPIDAAKYPKALLEILGDFPSNERVLNQVKEELEKKKFQVFVYEKENFEIGVDNVKSFKEKYDLVIYIGNVENASNQTTNRINWYTFWGQGNNVPWFVGEVPVLFISVANPYHLLDVPMIKTYINCYSNNEYFLKAVVEKITGNSEFKGKNPIDPFCGRRELGYEDRTFAGKSSEKPVGV